MKKHSVISIEVDEQGRFLVPAEVGRRYGLTAGSKVRLEEDAAGFRFSRSADHIARVYVEPTNQCNLDCLTCIRNVWDEAPGVMREEAFQHILDGIRQLDPVPTVFFGGFGEPLTHPGICTMVAQAHQTGAAVELITNGILLDAGMSRRLMEAGLNRVWVSMDGATPESYADVRLGASLPRVIDNLTMLRRLRYENPDSSLKLGIAFVAMQRNIADLPALIRLGQRQGADVFSISNVLPHTKALQNEILYHHALYQYRSQPCPSSPEVNLPRMDNSRELLEVLQDPVLRSVQFLYQGQTPGPEKSSCPFIEKGSISIRWDGEVSPCLPLLHSNEAYLDDRLRRSSEFSFGNINASSLMQIWQSEPYRKLRARLLDFDFSPCVICNSCEMADSNQEDCFGNVLPTCGGCLWAQGFIQCP